MFSRRAQPAQKFLSACRIQKNRLWARAFYQMKKAIGKLTWVIIRALAYKWICILFRCWQERTPYDELRDPKSLQRSRSPLLHYLAQPATNAS